MATSNNVKISIIRKSTQKGFLGTTYSRNLLQEKLLRTMIQAN